MAHNWRTSIDRVPIEHGQTSDRAGTIQLKTQLNIHIKNITIGSLCTTFRGISFINIMVKGR